MPKFFVTMNYVEAKKTSFCIEADNEDDVYEALGEIDMGFFENQDNIKWVCADYEPPIIDGVHPLNKTNSKMISCSAKQQKQIQKKFNKVMDSFNQAEVDSE